MAGRKAAPVPKRAVAKKSSRVSRRVPRRDPVIEVKVVDELPVTRVTANERSTRYARAMAEVRAKGVTGKWASIATFDGANGAASVRRDMLRGERQIDGRLADWAIESRRIRDAAGSIVGSELYVQLVSNK